MANVAQRVRRYRQSSLVSVRTTGIGSTQKRADTSRQILQENEFGIDTLGGLYLLPPYNPLFLGQCLERSNILPQCIDAYATNIALCGVGVAAINETTPIDEAERDELESFIEAANSEESMTSLNEKIVRSMETYGYGFAEIIRDRKGRLSVIRHAMSHTLRLMPKDIEPQLVTYEIARGRRVARMEEYRCFRRYIQIVNGKMRYFKEYGDLRTLDRDTGEYGCPKSRDATEIYHFKLPSDEPYGIPRWINQLPSILGSRELEEVNLRYFEDNTVPPILLTVAGGRLTGQSYREVTNILQKQNLGKDRQNKIILLEAVAERESLDDKGTVQLKVEKLTDARQSDGLFKEYDEGNQGKVRSAFRLPPVAIGMAQEHNFATASISAFVTETQVYLPLRNKHDERWNKGVVNNDRGLGLRTCCLASQVPLIANPELLVKSLTALNVMGAITPRMANDAANRVLQIDVPSYPKKGQEGYEEWMDQPISLSLKASNSGEPANTDSEQGLKDDSTKDIEGSGDVSPKAPEHGQE